MQTLLNKELLKLSNGVVLNYQEYDLNSDITNLLNKNIGHDNFIWFLRTSGTVLVREKFLNVSNCNDRVVFDYYKDNGFLKAFRIKVTERKRKNVYGIVEELNLKEIYNTYSNPKEHTYSFVKILDSQGKIVKNFNNEEVHKVDANKSYKDILFHLELDDTHKIFTIDYM